MIVVCVVLGWDGKSLVIGKVGMSMAIVLSEVIMQIWWLELVLLAVSIRGEDRGGVLRG